MVSSTARAEKAGFRDKKPTTALVLSAYTMGLGIIRALGRMGVPVATVQYDRRDMGQRSRFVSERLQAPHPAREEPAFIEHLLHLAGRYAGALLIPASDAALAAVSRHKSRLEEHYLVAGADWATARLFIQKKHTYELAASVGVAVPQTLIPQSLSEVETYAASVAYPVLVKPSQSHLFTAHFGTKMLRVEDSSQLTAAYQAAREADLEVILQEIIPGPDSNGLNYNAYFWDGEPLAEFTARKLRGAPPGFGSPRVARSERIPELLGPGRAVLQAMGYNGFACTEFKVDERDGSLKLMEVNGRHNLSGSLAVRCGVNFPWLEYNHLVNGVRPAGHYFEQFEEGVYWIDSVRDLATTLLHRRLEDWSLRDYLRPYLGPRVFADWDTTDPLPFLLRVIDAARLGLRMNH
jgi:predicted ATP-grasp superfamily ATP-dependent carboligase